MRVVSLCTVSNLLYSNVEPFREAEVHYSPCLGRCLCLHVREASAADAIDDTGPWPRPASGVVEIIAEPLAPRSPGLPRTVEHAAREGNENTPVAA